MNSTLLPVIIAGGSGSRLWPLSREFYPKQFLTVINDTSMLQQTFARLSDLRHQPPLLICNEEHRFIAAEQIRLGGFTHSGIILEPFGRNTAPAIALAALKALADNQDPLLLVLAADHVIQNKHAFTKAVRHAQVYGERGHLVTFGIVPDSPETGYGYIKQGSPIDETCFVVDSFVEKPDLATAKSYLESEQYFWNSGMFLFKASRYIEELGIYRPDILDACKYALSGSRNDLDFIRLNEEAFSACPGDSVDYAVMEKTNSAVVVPMDAGWSDVGSWSSLWEISKKDSLGNVLRGDVIVHDTKNSYISAPNKLVAAVGVDNLVIVETKDALLVAHKEKVQAVKHVVSELKKSGRTECLHHREVYRPWGMHDHIAEGDRYHVKKVVVKPGERTAMQVHYNRAEHWIVVSGSAKVFNGEKTYIVSENESTYIPVGSVHCFENVGKIFLEIIEVRTGPYLGEDDIVRVKSIGEGY